MAQDTLRVGIVGAAGYTGAELLRLVHRHPRLELVWVAGNSNAGRKLSEVLPGTLGVPGVGDLTIERFGPTDAPRLAKQLEVVFCCLPHAKSAEVVASLYAEGLRVVDLSADFRLRNLEDYRTWYGEHPAANLLAEAVYGLPELHRDALRGKRLIAAPGCYPTSAILPIAPLLSAGLLDISSPVIIDSKSGVSGAGRTPTAGTHFSETSEGIRAYKVAGTHRHTGEIEQELSIAAGQDVRVVFTPHLVPMTRGILSVAYLRPRPGVDAERCREAAKALYPSTGLVSVMQDELPDTLWVRGSARAHVAYRLDARTGTLLAFGAIDNLTRGASGQALHALNVALGWDEDLGLPQLGQFP
ncbi:MAG: N-acetyl-gamma-glutamyl-phosphate reductase [Polyangiaceae bacterium]